MGMPGHHMQQLNALLVTFIEKEGPFLKIWGQTNKATCMYIEQVLHNYSAQFNNGFGIPSQETFQLEILCCARYKEQYFRAKITNLSYLQNGYIEVNFIDYGNTDVVPVNNIRSLEGFENSFLSIPPQAQSFLLAEAVCPRGEWIDIYLDEISKEIKFKEVQFSILAQVTKHFLVKIFIQGSDFSLILATRGLMRKTSVSTQEAVLLSMIPRAPHQQNQSSATMQQNIATYKAFVLEPGSQYEVYVSYVTDGPCNFSVQLKQTEAVLAKLMKEINSMNLTPIEGLPLPGTVCLARCLEDGHICRAVVTNEVDGQFKVFYVDFGNFEVVPLDLLYEIPFKYVIPKVMAIRFALAGVEKSTVTLEMQCAFKEFVDNRLIHMKVMPMTARTALPRCELWDPETNISALDIVNQAAATAYPAHTVLNRGFCQPVKVSFVSSCNKFYVQLKAKEEELSRLMVDIQAICSEVDGIPSEAIKVGMPCYALFETDFQWYRSQVVEICDSTKVKVQYVDYGNEEIVLISALKPIEGKQLTILRPQAIECCLNGYQNMESDQERDNLLEELILEQEFTMRVVEMQDKKALVELIDASNYNVASLLLDKIAVTRSQVSPMLVQAGNKIEHRKSSYGPPKDQQPFGKPERVQKPRGVSANDTSWRRDSGKGPRNKSFESEENAENNTWRQNSKSFKRDNDLNDSNDNQYNNKSFKNRNNDYEARNGDGDNWKGNNNKNFNKNRDRPPRDNNARSNGWGDGDSNKREFSPHEKEDDWGSSSGSNKKNFNVRDDWGGNKDSERKSFKQREKSFNNGATDDWGDNNETKRGKGGWNNRDDRKDFKKLRDRETNGVNDSWNTNDSHNKSGGFKKKPDFRREGSEISSSGSEKSFRKGFKDKDNSRPNNFNKKFDRPPRDNKTNSRGSPSKSTKNEIDVPNPAPSDAQYTVMNLDQTESSVTISWFHNPGHFYCLLEDKQAEFKKMMGDIQEFYKDKKCGSAIVGAPIIGLFPEDNVLYRGQILEVVGSQYKILYVDFGNTSVIDKIWPIEKRFMDLPAQAVCCKLNGIEPPAENWPNASKYADYFNKPNFTCSFVRQDADKFAVKLSYNNEDIGDQLVSAGLAKASAVLPPIELPLLLSQQFRAMLLNVNGLSDFTMCLQNGALLSCSVFNLESSTETYEENLKDKLGQILIVYVDNVVNDGLHVTLYDSTGTKIKLINNDEGAFETVDLLCPYLIQYSTLYGEVTHVEESTIYVQPADCVQSIEYLLNQLYEVYETTTLETPIVPVEGFVYAVKGSDANWYRGRVTSFDDKTVVINYIDYGNSESVDLTALRDLTLEFMEIQILCVPVVVAGATEELVATMISLNINFTETAIEGVIQTQETQESVVQAVETPQPIEIPQTIPEVNESEPVQQQSQGNYVVLSHADSPCDFYLHLQDSLAAIDELQATLQEQAPGMADLENPAVGVLCAAPYSADQQWYRAQVLDADNDITTVRFVDYGNTDVLDNKTTKVKTLPPALLALEVHATRCRLKIKPIEDEWTAAASEKFEELCNVEALTVEFISQDEKTNYIELYSNGANVKEILIKENLALPDNEIIQETKSHGFVSHLNSPSEFWIQLENCVDELEWVAEQLSNVEHFAELEDLAPGTLCAALFPDDLMWYRARILSNTVAGIEVLFVDYGNSCTSCSLRELPEDLVMVPALAQKCSLQKPSGLLHWGPEMVKKFTEIAADGQTTFEIKKLSTGETALVELLVNGEDVAKMLLPITEDITVKNFESLDELTIIKNGEELEQKYKLEALPDVAWNEDSVKKFAELNNNGQTVFQAEFVSEDTLRLYLGLNDIRIDLSGVKTTTPTSSPVKIRSEIHSIVAEITDESINDVTSIVNNLVDNTLDVHSNSVVKPLVDSIVNASSNSETETVDDKKFVQEIVADAIDKKLDVKDTMSEVVYDIVEVVQEYNCDNDAKSNEIKETEVNAAGDMSTNSEASASIISSKVDEEVSSSDSNICDKDVETADSVAETPIVDDEPTSDAK